MGIVCWENGDVRLAQHDDVSRVDADVYGSPVRRASVPRVRIYCVPAGGSALAYPIQDVGRIRIHRDKMRSEQPKISTIRPRFHERGGSMSGNVACDMQGGYFLFGGHFPRRDADAATLLGHRCGATDVSIGNFPLARPPENTARPGAFRPRRTYLRRC